MEAVLTDAPKGHPMTEGADPSICPHLQNLKKAGKPTSRVSRKYKDREPDNSDPETESEEEDQKPRGGCPVMNQNAAKDPSLEVIKPTFK